jgi:hypothetical protein
VAANQVMGRGWRLRAAHSANSSEYAADSRFARFRRRSRAPFVRHGVAYVRAEIGTRARRRTSP